MRLGPRTLRGRLTALFAVGSAAVVVAGGFLLFADVTRKAEQRVNRNLERRAETIAEALQEGTLTLPRTEPFAQVVVKGPITTSVLTYSALIRAGELLITGGQFEQVYTEGPQRIDRIIPELGGRARLLAVPVTLGANEAVIVVGSSLEAEAAERERLLVRLGLAGPIFVALFSTGGWLLAGAALRPVLRMADEAAAVSSADTTRRLPLPKGADEIAHLGARLNEMLDRIETSFRRERAFVDDASHELRTPLAIMRAEVELALLHPGDPAETEATLHSLLDEIVHLSRLADDLLVLARAGAGQLRAADEPLPLLTACRAAVDRLRPGLPADLTVTVAGEPADACVDPDRLQRIITNLVGNATRYAAHRVAVRIAGAGRAGTAALLVADDGPGFAPDVLARAFERFTLGDAARTRPDGGRGSSGAGIGLAIVRALVEVDRGTVSATNGGPLGGAVVEVSYPAAPAAAPVASPTVTTS